MQIKLIIQIFLIYPVYSEFTPNIENTAHSGWRNPINLMKDKLFCLFVSVLRKREV